MATSNLPLPFDAGESRESRIDARDREARQRAVDPRHNVALEASAGTGKTRVLVDRYINLLRAGVDPANILAVTFTRKAAAEMRGRILATLKASAERGEIPPARWRELRDRTAEIEIGTIDAFCLSLLREFPLEADVDPGFSMADETEVPRLIDESLDRALRLCRSLAQEDEDVALVFAQLGDRRARAGLAALLRRRIVAPAVLRKYLASGPREWTVNDVAKRGIESLLDVFASMRGGLDAFLETGPLEPAFSLFSRHLQRIDSRIRDGHLVDASSVQAAFSSAREHFLTQDGEPRSRLGYSKAMFASVTDWNRHKDLVLTHSSAFRDVYKSYRRELNVLVSRGVWRMFRIAESEYRRTLDSRAALDFSDVLTRTLRLLEQMEEFAQSRYRLESRYHHVLVDEFQDTSRAQWELISLLVKSWGEGSGLAHTGPMEPSIFIVGDRKQSIYGFRDAEASMLEEAGRHLAGLRPRGDVHRSISRSFRSVPVLLNFVNDLCAEMDKGPGRKDAFRYEEEDRFPVDGMSDEEALGILAGDSPEASAQAVASEIARLLGIPPSASAQQAPPSTRQARTPIEIRDRDTGLRRPIDAGDIAILFRARESHREFEDALQRRGIRSYVYKGLGFFDADEIKDVLALIWYLASPLSDLRAAAWMRSRFVRLSDEGLKRLAPQIAEALLVPGRESALDEADARVLTIARKASARWRGLVDRMPPAELLDLVLHESAYAWEMRGPRFEQARENLKKVRGLIRRIQNRGYATVERIASHLDRLAVGDEANAVIDARNAVNLMTVHAAKGLEFPVVFVVNLAKGTGSRRDPIRPGTYGSGNEVSVAIGDFQSELDEDEPEREREETKRLLYVALTRARDRLYLGAALKEGRLQPARGSLAEVLPPSLVEGFNQAAGAGEFVNWSASSGKTHTLRVCSRVSESPPNSGPVLSDRPDRDSFDDFRRLEDRAPARRSVATMVMPSSQDTGAPSGGSDRLLGKLVHRLIQRAGIEQTEPHRLRALTSMLLRREETAELADPGSMIDRAVNTYRLICSQSGLVETYRAGEVVHEVPFTMELDGELVRGMIDCLVLLPGRRVAILEFKTGAARPEHEKQSELYRKAAERVFPDSQVEVRVVYPVEIAVL